MTPKKAATPAAAATKRGKQVPAPAPATAMLIARIPSELLAKLEATARQCGRSRSAEARLRLEESLARRPAMATADQLQG